MKPKHCKGCLLFAGHANKKNLTQGQKSHDDWCCAKGQPARKSVALCITHNLRKLP